MNILLIEQKGSLIGIIPLMRVKYGLPFLNFRTLETIGAVNCNMVGIIPPKYIDDALDTFLSYLRREIIEEGIYLRLILVPEDSLFFEKLQPQLASLSEDVAVEAKMLTLAPYIALPSTWDEYYGSLRRKRRQVLRRALGNLEKEHSVKMREYDRDSLEEGLNRFMDLHQSRWRAMHIRGVFSNPKMRNLYKDITILFYEKGWLYFTCLEVSGKAVSINFDFIYNNKLYCATAARDVDYSKYSVGHLHYLLLAKEAIEKKLDEMDTMRGDEPYKFYWAKSARRYMQITASRKRFYSGFFLKLLRLFFRFHNVSHYTPMEIFRLYLMKRKEEKQKEQMGRKKPAK